ncbi:hypothetical protein chiPu_0023864, partial [Chiloscyllium punctatum]|nr:hypothetical protein [Chiloscyllium punctatum]
CGVCAHNASVARVGEDAVLPCVFVPASIDGLIIEWTLRLEEIRLAYSYHHGTARVLNQHPQFRDRAEVNESLLGHGEASLQLRNVSIQDEGTYGCYVRSVLGKHEETQQLLVAGLSQPPARGVCCGFTDQSGRPPLWEICLGGGNETLIVRV